MNDREIVSHYTNGLTIRSIAKVNRSRTTVIREALRRGGINAAQQRGIRIGLTQKGQPKGCVTQKAPINNISDVHWAYLAGLFDGEGCLSPDKHGNFRVTVSQNGTALHQWIIQTVGEGYMRAGSSKAGNHYVYRLDAQLHVFQFLTGIQPYCIVKAATIQNALISIQKKYELT